MKIATAVVGAAPDRPAFAATGERDVEAGASEAGSSGIGIAPRHRPVVGPSATSGMDACLSPTPRFGTMSDRPLTTTSDEHRDGDSHDGSDGRDAII
jgi:hypothetical protein